MGSDVTGAAELMKVIKKLSGEINESKNSHWLNALMGHQMKELFLAVDQDKIDGSRIPAFSKCSMFKECGLAGFRHVARAWKLKERRLMFK